MNTDNRRGEIFMLSINVQNKTLGDKLSLYNWNLRTVYDAEVQIALYKEDFFIVPEFFHEEGPSHIMLKVENKIIGAIGKYSGRFHLYNANGKLIRSCPKSNKTKVYADIPPSMIPSSNFPRLFSGWAGQNKRRVFSDASSGNIHMLDDGDNAGLAANLSFYNATFKHKDWLCIYDCIFHPGSGVNNLGEDAVYAIHSGKILQQYPKHFDLCDYYWFLLGMIILSNVFD